MWQQKSGSGSAMRADDPVDQALTFIRRAAEGNCLAHAYLVLGDPDGPGETLAGQAAAYLLCRSENEKPCGNCANCGRVRRLAHPDYFRIEPEKKSRVIDVESMREMIRNLHRSSYEGGWKVACVRFADRLNQSAANAFLKTLEEPPERTLILLLTDALDAVLPTVVSRCQRLYLGTRTTKSAQTWTAALDELLGVGALHDPLVQTYVAHRLSDLIAVERKRIETEERERHRDDDPVSEDIFKARVEAKLRRVRRGILEAMQLWQRDLVILVAGGDPALLHHADARDILERQAAEMDIAAALRRVRAIEEMHQRLERMSKPELTLIETSIALMAAPD